MPRSAARSTNLKQLAEIGTHPPAADALGDEGIPSALGILIDALAALGVYLPGTDRLTDRKLYGVPPPSCCSTRSATFRPAKT